MLTFQNMRTHYLHLGCNNWFESWPVPTMLTGCYRLPWYPNKCWNIVFKKKRHSWRPNSFPSPPFHTIMFQYNLTIQTGQKSYQFTLGKGEVVPTLK